MKCLWCHNPEGMNVRKEIGYYKNRCIGCGECIKACKNNALAVKHASIAIDRNVCIGCGNCAAACNSDALVLYGEDKTPEQIADTVMKDKCFYGADVWVRIPVIPAFNDTEEETEKINGFLKQNKLHQVSYLPFHNYASEKYKSLDLTYTYENSKANGGNLRELSDCLRQKRY